MRTTVRARRGHISPVGVGAWLTCLAALVLAGCASHPQPVAAPARHGWTQDEVSDSYLFGYPLVVMASAKEAASGPGGAGVNKLKRLSPATTLGAPDDPNVLPRPDLDTLSSDAWLDLTAEPVLLSLPATRGQYLDARVLDMWTNVVWSTGSLAASRGAMTKPRVIAFVGPGWTGELPDNVERVNAPAKSLWLDVRIAARGQRELAAARRLQERVEIAPLSAFDADVHVARATRGKRNKRIERDPGVDEASDGTVDSTVDGSDPLPYADTPAAQALRVASLDAKAFFGKLADALRDNAPSPDDPHALDILADFGVKPGEPVRLPEGAADAISGGLADGRERIATAPDNVLSANGWSWIGDGVGHYGDDYALRAYATYRQAGSGTKEDEIVATATVDGQGQALDGGKRYLIHFPAKQLPPARAFWTLTAYTKDGALAGGRAPHRSIASSDALRRNRDGSLDVYVQAPSPGRARQANWLPVPDGPFEVVMRLYAPQPSAVDGAWEPPPLMRR